MKDIIIDMHAGLFGVPAKPAADRPDAYDNGEYVTLYEAEWDEDGCSVEILGYEVNGFPISASALSEDYILVTEDDIAQMLMADAKATAEEYDLARAIDADDERREDEWRYDNRGA